MKVTIYQDSAMCTVAWKAGPNARDTIEVPDEVWDEFERVQARYEELLCQFSEQLSKQERT